jgi:mannose-6-phosphate isomerase-like protein (cupin superfamily)
MTAHCALDMGTYQLAIAVAMHEPTTKVAAPASAAAPRDPKAVHCGLPTAPAGAKMGPRDGISHDDTTETYVMISGSGTLVTGGQIVNGTRSAPDSETSKYLAGPSCLGAMVGDIVTTKVGPGDVVVIPAGVPHGWVNVTEKVTYLTVRPDPKKVLQHGYVNPAIK